MAAFTRSGVRLGLHDAHAPQRFRRLLACGRTVAPGMEVAAARRGLMEGSEAGMRSRRREVFAVRKVEFENDTTVAAYDMTRDMLPAGLAVARVME